MNLPSPNPCKTFGIRHFIHKTEFTHHVHLPVPWACKIKYCPSHLHCFLPAACHMPMPPKYKWALVLSITCGQVSVVSVHVCTVCTHTELNTKKALAVTLTRYHLCFFLYIIAFAGDTFTKSFQVKSVRNTTDGNHSVRTRNIETQSSSNVIYDFVSVLTHFPLSIDYSIHL